MTDTARVIAEWKAKQPADLLACETVLTRFVAGLNDATRVFCRGTVRLDKGQFPAVLTYNPTYKQTLAWAPSGKKLAMEGHHEAHFWSDIPHKGIAREVLSPSQTTVAHHHV